MRAGTADAFGAPVKTKTFEAKLVKATAGGIVARAEADADLNLRCALPDWGRAPVQTSLERGTMAAFLCVHGLVMALWMKLSAPLSCG
jgi:hypothetical protein